MSALPEVLYRRNSSYATDDALGSVRMITDSTGASVAHYEYDAFGNLLASSSDISFGFNYRYIGSYGVRYDATLSLLYMRNRWYDPSSQRFISRDPLRSSNRYTYGYNSPMNWVDPLGLAPQSGLGAAGSALNAAGQGLTQPLGGSPNLLWGVPGAIATGAAGVATGAAGAAHALGTGIVGAAATLDRILSGGGGGVSTTTDSQKQNKGGHGGNGNNGNDDGGGGGGGNDPDVCEKMHKRCIKCCDKNVTTNPLYTQLEQMTGKEVEYPLPEGQNFWIIPGMGGYHHRAWCKRDCEVAYITCVQNAEAKNCQNSNPPWGLWWPPCWPLSVQFPGG